MELLRSGRCHSYFANGPWAVEPELDLDLDQLDLHLVDASVELAPEPGEVQSTEFQE